MLCVTESLSDLFKVGSLLLGADKVDAFDKDWSPGVNETIAILCNTMPDNLVAVFTISSFQDTADRWPRFDKA